MIGVDEVLIKSDSRLKRLIKSKIIIYFEKNQDFLLFDTIIYLDSGSFLARGFMKFDRDLIIFDFHPASL